MPVDPQRERAEMIAARRRVPVGIVAGVTPGSAAERAGIMEGDHLIALNGVVPRDIIDVRLDAAAECVELDIERAGARSMLTIEKDADEELGIEFSDAVFDRMKTCNNGCDFCFIRGLPPGLRRSLYIKDDDFRLSFLYGNFTTLTNLTDAEWQRLLFQRLSPLRVSVHATDPELRRRLLSNPRAPAILPQLDELALHGIETHAQIVLMPGRNDGAVLEQTLDDLAARQPSVASAAVVPVGLTIHSKVEGIRPLTPSEAAAAVDLVEAKQKGFRKQFGYGFAYASDELYLLADRALPSPRRYDDYPQLQNGVGLIQLFRDGWKRATRRLPKRVETPLSVCWVTGPLVASFMRELADGLQAVDGLTVTVVPVANSLFGGAVTVAGLLSASDVVATLSPMHFDRVVLPRSMFDWAEQLSIDSKTTREVADEIETDVVVASSPRELLDSTVGARGEVKSLVRPSSTEEQLCAAS